MARLILGGQVIEHTQSLCPICLKLLPAKIITNERDGVWMEWACPDHGHYDCRICPDLDSFINILNVNRIEKKPRIYKESIRAGCPEDCGLCPAHKQHTCLAIFDITTRCNASCPICLSDAKTAGHDVNIETVEYVLKELLCNEGSPVPLQLSGGEPTLHKDIVPIVRVARSLGFNKIEIDTNGLALAQRQSLCFELKEAGLNAVYLQMDSTRPHISRTIRGQDLTEIKYRAIENCKHAGLEIVLSVTVVPGLNSEHMWEMVQFGIAHNLTGVNFQPVVLSGRYPSSLSSSLTERLTLGHFQKKMEAQSGGMLRASDMMPIPCPSPFCGGLAYVIVGNGEFIPLNRILTQDRLSGYLADQTDWEGVAGDLNDDCICSKGCRNKIEGPSRFLDGYDYFSIGFHGMMDAFCFDIERVKRCCVHELLPDGKLIPFCLYNLKYRSITSAGAHNN